MTAKNKGLIDRLKQSPARTSSNSDQSSRAEETSTSATRPPETVGARDDARTIKHDLRAASQEELTVFIVAGEHSGDLLGAGLMQELTERRKGQIRFLGVGGEAMEAQGLTSLFPLADIAVMGPVAIVKALPRLTSRVYRTVAAGVAAKPDVIVIIDSPEFTHQVGKRLSRKLPGTPIIDYVCPSVWAWRPGRARKMARFIDHVLTLLPFEPAALERLGGPDATYVGHPLSERLDWIQDIDIEVWAARLGLDPERIPLVVLPGSRRSEVDKLMPVFGETISALDQAGYNCDLLMPCVPHLRGRIQELSKDWPMRRHYLDGDEAKFAAFRIARAALAASGTVTLELGVSGTPMVVAYRVDGIAAKLRFLLKVESVVLANLVLEMNAFPELLQEDCNAEELSAALIKLLEDGAERQAQVKALAQLAEKMQTTDETPSKRAADVVMRYASRRVTRGM